MEGYWPPTLALKTKPGCTNRSLHWWWSGATTLLRPFWASWRTTFAHFSEREGSVVIPISPGCALVPLERRPTGGPAAIRDPWRESYLVLSDRPRSVNFSQDGKQLMVVFMLLTGVTYSRPQFSEKIMRTTLPLRRQLGCLMGVLSTWRMEASLQRQKSLRSFRSVARRRCGRGANAKSSCSSIWPTRYLSLSPGWCSSWCWGTALGILETLFAWCQPALEGNLDRCLWSCCQSQCRMRPRLNSGCRNFSLTLMDLASLPMLTDRWSWVLPRNVETMHGWA